MQNNKPWYVKWWGILLLLFFWRIAVPIAIFQSKINKVKKIIFFGVYLSVFILSILIHSILFKIDSPTVATSTTENTTVEKTESQKEEKVVETVSVESEKRRIKKILIGYRELETKVMTDNLHLLSSINFSQNYSINDASELKNDLNTAKTTIGGIQKKLNNLNCKRTDDEQFNVDCKNLILLSKKYYLESFNLLKMFSNLMEKTLIFANSPSSKANNDIQKTLEKINNEAPKIHSIQELYLKEFNEILDTKEGDTNNESLQF